MPDGSHDLKNGMLYVVIFRNNEMGSVDEMCQIEESLSSPLSPLRWRCLRDDKREEGVGQFIFFVEILSLRSVGKQALSCIAR